MNVSLTPELEEFVSAKVGTGRYNSASEVVREALRLLEEYGAARGAQIAAFNQKLGHRLASLDRGERVDPASVRTRIEGKSRARKKDQRVSLYVLSTAAELDLDSIWDYIAQDNIDAVNRWISRLS